IYLVGGYAPTSATNTMEIYHSAGQCGARTATPSNTPGGPSNTPVNTNTPTRTPTGVILTATATACTGGPTPTWQPGPTYTPGVYAVQGASPLDGNFYVAGGQTAANVAVAHVAKFNSNTNTWTAVAPLPVAVG